MSVAAADSEQQHGCTAPFAGTSRERRASLVIAETADVLQGLRMDANRSDALMAELESLLSSCRSASQNAHMNGWSATADMVASPHFTVVHPLQGEPTDSEEGEEEDEIQEASGPHPASSHVLTEKRRSSIILMDGLSVFGNGSQSPLGPGTASGSGPAPFAAAAGTAAFASRAASFSRGRRCLRNSSWTEGRPGLGAGAGGLGMRARGPEVLGGAAQAAAAAAAAQPGLLAVSGSGGSFSGKLSGALHHVSTTDEEHMSGRLTSHVRRVPRRGASLPAGCLLPTPMLPRSRPSAIQPCGSYQEGGTDSGEAEGLTGSRHLVASPVASAEGVTAEAGGAEGEQAGSRTPRARTARFVNVLKGMFNTQGQQRGDTRSAAWAPASPVDAAPEPEPQLKLEPLRSNSFRVNAHSAATLAAGATAVPAVFSAVGARSLSTAHLFLGRQERASGAAAVPEVAQLTADGRAASARRASVLACSLPQIN